MAVGDAFSTTASKNSISSGERGANSGAPASERVSRKSLGVAAWRLEAALRGGDARAGLNRDIYARREVKGAHNQHGASEHVSVSCHVATTLVAFPPSYFIRLDPALKKSSQEHNVIHIPDTLS